MKFRVFSDRVFSGVFIEFQEVSRVISGGFSLCPFRVCPLDPFKFVMARMSHKTGRTQWVPFSLLFVCQANSPSFSQNSPSLPRNSVRLSEFSSPKQYFRNGIPPVSWNFTPFYAPLFVAAQHLQLGLVLVRPQALCVLCRFPFPRVVARQRLPHAWSPPWGELCNGRCQ